MSLGGTTQRHAADVTESSTLRELEVSLDFSVIRRPSVRPVVLARDK